MRLAEIVDHEVKATIVPTYENGYLIVALVRIRRNVGYLTEYAVVHVDETEKEAYTRFLDLVQKYSVLPKLPQRENDVAPIGTHHVLY